MLNVVVDEKVNDQPIAQTPSDRGGHRYHHSHEVNNLERNFRLTTGLRLWQLTHCLRSLCVDVNSYLLTLSAKLTKFFIHAQ